MICQPWRLPAAAARQMCDAEGGRGGGDLVGDLPDGRRRQAALGLGELGRVLRVLAAQLADERVERRLARRRPVGEVRAPVDPAADELAVVEALVEEDLRDREQHGRLRARPRRQPVVGDRGGVRQPRVHDGDLRAALLGLDDALGVRVEVVPGLQVRGDEQQELRVGVVRGRAVGAGPEAVAGAPAGGADVGVRVVPVGAPRLEEAVGEAVLARAPDEVQDVVRVPGGERVVHLLGERVEHVVPAAALPLARAARTVAPLRVEDPLGVVELVDRRRALGAVAPATAGVVRVALELADLEGLLVDERRQPAGRLAVEADRRHEDVLALDLARPGVDVVLRPGVPLLDRREALQRLVLRAVAGGAPRALAIDAGHQLSGTLWPARTHASS